MDLFTILLLLAAGCCAIAIFMASPTEPTHGKIAAVYRLRPNGFKGSGLNDATWGAGFNGAASAYFEVVIDAEGIPDTFKWRVNGGAWTTGVAITGAAQTLSDSQTITFAATTGHTDTDQWTIGNFKDEATTEVGATAQITDATKRILNMNAPPTFTDDGGETVLITDYASGTAYFTGNVGNVDVDGNNGFIVRSGLQKVGYLRNWELDVTLDMADISAQGDAWKTALPGMAGFTGRAGMIYVGDESFWDCFEDCVDGTQDYFLLELFNYDPDADQTGDRLVCWVTLSGINFRGPMADVVQENVQFQGQGIPGFVANA